jgi:hypothetical protein
MFKAYKASDQQWIEWIRKADQKEEKIWAFRFFGLAGISVLVSVTGMLFGKIEFIGIAVGALLFFLMGAAKLNNYRLYGIIQSLTCDSEGKSEKSREPGAVVNASAAVGKPESRLHD